MNVPLHCLYPVLSRRKGICLILLLSILCFCVSAGAQKYKSASGTVSFSSDAPIEKIAATNSSISALMDLSSGEVACSVRIMGFEFKKSLMKEHFNEKYMESDRFPNATFQGTITGYRPDLSGAQQLMGKGQLTIHGHTQMIEIAASFEVGSREILMAATFIVKLEDYKIRIPKLLWKNIAEEVEVRVNLVFKPL